MIDDAVAQPLTGVVTHSSDDVNAQTRIWVVPEPALQWGYENQHHVHAGNTMILPAEEVEWRDNQHYRAYVRPTKEET